MIRKYNIEFKNHIAVLSYLMITTLVLIIGTLIIGIRESWPSLGYYIVSIFWILELIVITLIHQHYLKRSRNIFLIINPIGKQLIYDSIELKKNFYFDEITKIEVHMVPSMYRGSTFQITPWEQFHYALFYTEKDKFIITCLVMRDIMKELDYFGLKYTKVKRIFPYINTPK